MVLSLRKAGAAHVVGVGAAGVAGVADVAAFVSQG